MQNCTAFLPLSVPADLILISLSLSSFLSSVSLLHSVLRGFAVLRRGAEAALGLESISIKPVATKEIKREEDSSLQKNEEEKFGVSLEFESNGREEDIEEEKRPL